MILSQDTIRISLLAVALALLPASLWARGDPAEGQKKSQVCQACHVK